MTGGQRWLLRGAVLAVALIAGAVTWLATRDSGSPAEPSTAIEPSRIVSEEELPEAAGRLGQPIYWAGPVTGTELELEELGEGGVRLRYLPEGTEAGDAPAGVLTVGSYLLPDPAEALERFARRRDTVVRHAGGREIVFSKRQPTSVYFVDPEDSVQVEVYDPASKRAISLAASGKVGPAE